MTRREQSRARESSTTFAGDEDEDEDEDGEGRGDVVDGGGGGGIGRSSVDITWTWMSSVLARKDFEKHFLISHNQVVLFLTLLGKQIQIQG